MVIWFLSYHNNEHYPSTLHFITFFIQCFILPRESGDISATWATNPPITSSVILVTHVEQLKTHLIFLQEPSSNTQRPRRYCDIAQYARHDSQQRYRHLIFFSLLLTVEIQVDLAECQAVIAKIMF